MRNVKWICAGTMAVALLAACGGGSDGTPVAQNVPGTDVPVGAQQRVGDVISFAQLLIANTSDTSDPVLIDGATLAVSETDDPVGI